MSSVSVIPFIYAVLHQTGRTHWKQMLEFINDEDNLKAFAAVMNICFDQGIAAHNCQSRHKGDYGRDRIVYVRYDLQKYGRIKSNYIPHLSVFQRLVWPTQLSSFINQHKLEEEEDDDSVINETVPTLRIKINLGLPRPTIQDAPVLQEGAPVMSPFDPDNTPKKRDRELMESLDGGKGTLFLDYLGMDTAVKRRITFDE
jgi:hypothetical protein